MDSRNTSPGVGSPRDGSPAARRSESESLTAPVTRAGQGQTGESGEPRRTEPRPLEVGGEQRPGGYVTRSDSDAAESRLDFSEARDLIQLTLKHLLDQPHAEHFGPLCPVCGLVTATQRFVREWTP